jgi:hypothetical protein
MFSGFTGGYVYARFAGCLLAREEETKRVYTKPFDGSGQSVSIQKSCAKTCFNPDNRSKLVEPFREEVAYGMAERRWNRSGPPGAFCCR